jgi:hypothetical protein
MVENFGFWLLSGNATRLLITIYIVGYYPFFFYGCPDLTDFVSRYLERKRVCGTVQGQQVVPTIVAASPN